MTKKNILENLNMTTETIKIKVFRFDPETDQQAAYQTFDVPFEEGMSAMTALDYIYHHLDSTLTYYDHAGCDLGICARCAGKINGKPGLFCQTLLEGDTILDPRSQDNVLRDLITFKSKS